MQMHEHLNSATLRPIIFSGTVNTFRDWQNYPPYARKAK